MLHCILIYVPFVYNLLQLNFHELLLIVFALHSFNFMNSLLSIVQSIPPFYRGYKSNVFHCWSDIYVLSCILLALGYIVDQLCFNNWQLNKLKRCHYLICSFYMIKMNIYCLWYLSTWSTKYSSDFDYTKVYQV